MRTIPAITLASLLLLSGTAWSENKTMTDEKAIKESTVMFYYSDLTAPRQFYGGLLGLTANYDDDWVSIYSLTPGSAVGLVLEGGTAYHRAKKDNAVMLSITVSNTDAWYKKIQADGDIKILKDIYNHDKAPIRAFLVEDPGGYTVEFFQWLK